MNLLEAEFGEPRHKWATQAGAIRVLDRELPSTCLGRLLHCLDMAGTAMLCRPLDFKAYVIAMKLDRTSGPYFKAYEYWLAQTEPDQHNAASLARRLDITHADLSSQEMRAQSALSALKMIQPSAGEAYERLFKASPITDGSASLGVLGAAPQPLALPPPTPPNPSHLTQAIRTAAGILQPPVTSMDTVTIPMPNALHSGRLPPPARLPRLRLPPHTTLPTAEHALVL